MKTPPEPPSARKIRALTVLLPDLEYGPLKGAMVKASMVTGVKLRDWIVNTLRDAAHEDIATAAELKQNRRHS